MRDLRLGTLDLPQAEVGLIRALLLLFAQDSESFPWIFCMEGPFDALVVDAKNALAISSHNAHMAVRILLVGDMPPADATHELTRPIEALRLEQWLKATAQSLLSVMRSAWPTQMPSARYGAVPVAARRFRLLRWPPAALLQRDKARLRMATLIAKRPMTVRELSDISGEPEERCSTFLRLLQGFNLLDIQLHVAQPFSNGRHRGASGRSATDAPNLRLTTPVRTSTTDRTEEPKPLPQRRLVDSIRKRLGIWIGGNEGA